MPGIGRTSRIAVSKMTGIFLHPAPLASNAPPPGALCFRLLTFRSRPAALSALPARLMLATAFAASLACLCCPAAARQRTLHLRADACCSASKYAHLVTLLANPEKQAAQPALQARHPAPLASNAPPHRPARCLVRSASALQHPVHAPLRHALPARLMLAAAVLPARLLLLPCSGSSTHVTSAR